MNTRSITVAGTGSAEGTPDAAVIVLRAQHMAQDARQALEGASTVAQLMAESAQSLGAVSLSTSNVSLQSHWREGQEDGYVAEISLTANAPVELVGRVLAAVTEAGGNSVRIVSLDFVHSSAQALGEQARAAAFADAKTKAEEYARLAGVSLGDLQELTEDWDRIAPAPKQMRAMAASGPVSPVPIEAGALTVLARVVVRWQLL